MSGFSFTTEQLAVAAVVRDLLSEICSREFLAEAPSSARLRADLWSELDKIGVPALAVPEKDGGLGLGAVDLVCVAEAAGAFPTPVPLVSTAGMFVPLIAAVADCGGHELLREVAAGRATGTICYSIEQPLPRLQGDCLTSGDRLIGEARADWVAIPTVMEDGAIGLVVARPQDLNMTELSSIDRTRPVGRVRLEKQPTDNAMVLRGDARRGLHVGVTSLAAELVGLGEQLVSLSIAHARDRAQFGRPIGAFQAVKHRLVDAHLAIELARSLTYRAAVVADDPNANDATRSTVIHLSIGAASEAVLQAARTAIQIHGGIGLSRDHDVSLLYLRARQAAGWLGRADLHFVAATAAGA